MSGINTLDRFSCGLRVRLLSKSANDINGEQEENRIPCNSNKLLRANEKCSKFCLLHYKFGTV